jgi:hypothetical protein
MMDTSNCKEQPNKQEDVAGRKEAKQEKSKWKLNHDIVDSESKPDYKIIYRLDGLLDEGTMDRVKSRSCDCPANIPMDTNARYFKSFSSDSSSPEVAEFCPTLCLVYCIAKT